MPLGRGGKDGEGQTSPFRCGDCRQEGAQDAEGASEEPGGGEKPPEVSVQIRGNHDDETCPEVPLAAELLPELLGGDTGELKYLVDEKGTEVQKEEVEGEVLLPGAVVVLEVVSLVLERVEGL